MPRWRAPTSTPRGTPWRRCSNPRARTWSCWASSRLTAIMGAKKKPLDTKATGDVGIDAGQVGTDGSKTAVLELKPPPAKEAGEIIEDEDTNETVEKIVAWLDERKLI